MKLRKIIAMLTATAMAAAALTGCSGGPDRLRRLKGIPVPEYFRYLSVFRTVCCRRV